MGKETIDNSNETHQQNFESLSTVVLLEYYLSIKPVCDIKWSARSDAVKENYERFKHFCVIFS